MKMEFSKMMRSTEFAEQLCILYDHLPVEKKNRNYIHKWLMTILSDENTEVAEFPTVTKKIRDEVLGGSEKKQSGISSEVFMLRSDYFRRSNFYMAMKVFLQLQLTLELGCSQGKFVYKIVMLSFLSEMCKIFEDSFYETLNIDLMTQLMAKIARRIEKLKPPTDADENAKEFYDAAIERAKKSLSAMRKKIDKQIFKLETEECKKSQLQPLIELDFCADVFQQVPNLRQHLKKRLSQSHQNMYSAALQVKVFNRHRMNESTKPILPQRLPEMEQNLILTDFENWVLYSLPFEENDFTCESLSNLSMDYASVAQDFYSGDQLGISKMLLVRFKLLGMIDRIAAEIHPLLLKHFTCIDTGIYDVLLLPHSIDMEIANELQNYFNYRNNAATKPGLIEENEVTSKSFAVNFAAQNNKMQKIRQEILDLGERNIEAKRVEWENGRDEVERLRKRASLLKCEYYTYYCPVYKMRQTKHRKSCSLCSLNSQIGAVQVVQYERPLPFETLNSLIKQNAVVFELQIPIEIAKLRDVLHSTIKYCHTPPTSKLKIKGDWIQYFQISSHNKSSSKLVSLGSMSSVSLNSYHVDESFDSFIVENGYNYIYHASTSALNGSIAIKAIKNSVTLTVESTSKYSGLQWTVKTTNHYQNQVLARQELCPGNLSISEFKNFGSLRADGHRLQIRKLYAMIETEALSFDEMSTLSLILQTIWETGVRGDCGFMRESFEDFFDTKFSSAMITLLESYIDKQKDNWVHTFKLLTVTLISVRIFDLNNDENIANQLVALLHKLRIILLDWIEKIKKAVTEMQDVTQENESLLRSKLAIASIAAAMTFFVNSKHQFFEKIFSENPVNKFSAPRIWLQSIITLNNNLLLSCTRTKFEEDLRMFIRLVRNVGIHVESQMQSIIRKDQSDLVELIKTQWTLAKDGEFMKYYFAPNCLQVVVVDFQIKGHEKCVTIDLITGSFLVNNLPVARLPENVNKHKLFQRTFQQYIFEVQPDASNRFSSVHKYNGCSYEFGWSNDELVIKEHRNDSTEVELIPHTILSGEIPYLLVENFSHWWNKHENIIEFRPKLFTDPNFSDKESIAYTLDMNISRLMETKTQRHMLDINSHSYRKILLHLARLEQKDYIHVLMDKPNVAKIELVRMNLKFKVDCYQQQEYCDMLSNEFSRMRVSLEQNCGTLYGLNHGLLLENVPCSSFEKSPASKLLLLPHSSIKTSLTDSHISVSIDLNSSLRSPPFHRYQVDEFLRQLKASNSNFSAWFYLAYLHAITSHGEVESLTGMSGTERALQILQSSFVWSTAPYDLEAVKVLRSIASLSPKRRMNEDNFQKVKWPKDLLQHSAQDTFAVIINKLIEDSQRLSSLYFRDDNLKLETKGHFLNTRDYLRCLQLKPNAVVSDSFVKHNLLATTSHDVPKIHYSTNTRSISCLYHLKTSNVPEFSLDNYLKSTGRLDGPIHTESLSNILNHTNSVSLRNLWITLYNAARTHQLSREQYGLIWSLFVHEAEPIEPILALQTIQNNSTLFANISPPPIYNYITSAGTYKAERIAAILEENYSRPSLYDSESWSDKDREAHDNVIANNISSLTNIVTSSWPCDKVTLPSNCDKHIKITKANSSINEMLMIWNNNLKLTNFLQEISIKLLQVNSTKINPKNLSNVPSSIENWPKYKIDFEKKLSENVMNFEDVTADAYNYWIMNRKGNKSACEWWSLYQKIVYSNDKKHLIDAGMTSRMVPTLILPRILCEKTNAKLRCIIGALALAMAAEQRKLRMEIYKQNPQLKPALDREIENEPHINWKPSEYPEWLLFEIEQNLTIRRIQIEIAKRMIEPAEIGTKHSVMQLNMGEGKTAVIVPILALRLADGNQACQITVLKSLYATNLKSLRQYLGGMLNKRIYTFPCRRDNCSACH